MKKKRIAIIGADIAGVAAAISLKEKGYEPVIFNDRAAISIQHLTKRVSIGHRLYKMEMGPAEVSISDRYLLSWIRTLKKPLQQTSKYEVQKLDGTFTSLERHAWPSGYTLPLIWAGLKYWVRANAFSARFLTSTGYTEEMPDKFQRSFGDYCKDQGLQRIKHWFNLPIQAKGYGSLSSLPAYAVLGSLSSFRFVELILTQSLGYSFFSRKLELGFSNLLQSAISHYGVAIRTTEEIHKIERNKKSVSIYTEKDHYLFDYLILTNAGNLAMLDNLDPKEKKVLSEVKYHAHAAVLCLLEEKLWRHLLIKENMDKRNAIQLIHCNPDAPQFAVVHLTLNPDATEVMIKNAVEEQMKTIGLPLKTIKEIKINNTYFPHFYNFDAYRAFQSLQGENLTFFIGAINQFESVESILATTEELINQNFVPLIRTKRTSKSRWMDLFYLLKSW